MFLICIQKNGHLNFKFKKISLNLPYEIEMSR